MRLFIAVEAPEAWRCAAAEAQRQLDEALPEEARRALRPVDPSRMHLTVRFLGEVNDRGIDALQAALDAYVQPFALDLSLAAAGTFGSPSRTAVAWLGVGGDVDGLRVLAARVEEAVRAAGLPEEERELSPHLTLARVHRSATSSDRRAIADAIRSLPAPVPAPVQVREVLLLSSRLGPGGPRYDVLSRHGDHGAAIDCA